MATSPYYLRSIDKQILDKRFYSNESNYFKNVSSFDLSQQINPQRKVYTTDAHNVHISYEEKNKGDRNNNYRSSSYSALPISSLEMKKRRSSSNKKVLQFSAIEIDFVNKLKLYGVKRKEIIKNKKRINSEIERLKSQIAKKSLQLTRNNEQKINIGNKFIINRKKKNNYIRFNVADILEIVEKLFGENNLDKVISELERLHAERCAPGTEIKLSYNLK